MAKQTFFEGFEATTKDGTLVITTVSKKKNGANLYTYTVNGVECEKPVTSDKIKSLIGMEVAKYSTSGNVTPCTAKDDSNVFQSLIDDIKTASAAADEKLAKCSAVTSFAKRCGREEIAATLAVMEMCYTVSNNISGMDAAEIAQTLGLKEATVAKVINYIVEHFAGENRRRFVTLYHDFRMKQAEHRAAAAAAVARKAANDAKQEDRKCKDTSKQLAGKYNSNTLEAIVATNTDNLQGFVSLSAEEQAKALQLLAQLKAQSAAAV